MRRPLSTFDVTPQLYDEYRLPVGYNDIAPDVIRAIISIEDRGSSRSCGVNIKCVALWRISPHRGAGSFVNSVGG